MIRELTFSGGFILYFLDDLQCQMLFEGLLMSLAAGHVTEHSAHKPHAPTSNKTILCLFWEINNTFAVMFLVI